MPLSEHVALSLDGVSAPTADAALKFVRAIPAAQWGKVLPSSKEKTRIRFGAQEFYGVKGGGAVPPPLRALGEEAFEAVRASLPANIVAAGWRPVNCLVNKYSAKKGVAKHRDPAATWAPLVIGVTLYEDRFDTLSAMQFSTLPDAPKLEKLRVGTPHRSIYAFHGDAFLHANHERLPGSAKQAKGIYSFTFRCGVDELDAAAAGGANEGESEDEETSEEAYWREEAEEAAERMRAERERVAEFKVGQEVARIAHGGHLASVATVAASIDPPERLDEAAIALPRAFEEGIALFESKGEQWHLSGQSHHTESWPQLRAKLRSVPWYRVEWHGPAPARALMTEILPEFALAERVLEA